MFQTVPLSIIRSFSLYTQQWYVIQVCWHTGFRRFICPSSGVFHCTHINVMSHRFADIYHCCLQWKTPDDGQRNCPKYV